MKTTNPKGAGRKLLPLGEKKETVYVFISKKDLDKLGGKEEAKDIMYVALDKVLIKQKHIKQ